MENCQQEREIFWRCMAMLNEVFNDQDKPISDLKFDIYFKAFENVSIEELQAAVEVLIKTRVYKGLPTPAEIIKAIPEMKIEEPKPIAKPVLKHPEALEEDTTPVVPDPEFKNKIIEISKHMDPQKKPRNTRATSRLTGKPGEYNRKLTAEELEEFKKQGL